MLHLVNPWLRRRFHRPLLLGDRRGASRAALLDQRKKEVQDAAVVGALVNVKVVCAEAWTTRAGAAMSSSS